MKNLLILFTTFVLSTPVFSQCESCVLDSVYVSTDYIGLETTELLTLSVSAGTESRIKIKKWLNVFLWTEDGGKWVKSKVPNGQYLLDLARTGYYRIEIVRNDKRGYYNDKRGYYLNRAANLSIAAKTVGLIGLGSSGIVAAGFRSQAGLFTAVGISVATGITSLVLAFSSDANLKEAAKP